jgi:hypothetical protein
MSSRIDRPSSRVPPMGAAVSPSRSVGGESFASLHAAASLIGCDLVPLPGDRYRLSRSGLARDFTAGALIVFLRTTAQ